MENKIIQCSKQNGFDESYLLPIIEFNNNAFNPNKLLNSAQSVLLLIKKHNPYSDFPKGSMTVHSHYPAYQKAYILHKKLIDNLNEMGVKAVSANSLPQKSYALSAGLARLKNSLVYHPKFGTYFAMQTIVTDAQPLSYEKNIENYCSDCSKCVTSCPTYGISEDGLVNQRKCIRNYVPVKESISDYLMAITGTNYIGCGICQSVCPLNHKMKKVKPNDQLVDCLNINHMLDITNDKLQLEKLSYQIGKNEVRPGRAIATACLAAGNTRSKKYLPNLERILSTYISPLARSYAASAIGMIGTRNDYLENALKHEKDTFVKIAILSALIDK